MSQPEATVIDTQLQPRHAPGQICGTADLHVSGSVEQFIKDGRKFLGHAGDLDVWAAPQDGGSSLFRIVCDMERSRGRGARFTYTAFQAYESGQLEFADTDVIPTPYELCMLYQIVKDMGHGGI